MKAKFAVLLVALASTTVWAQSRTDESDPQETEASSRTMHVAPTVRFRPSAGCVPFKVTRQVRLQANESGNGNEFQAPKAQGKYLRVDKVTAWLDDPGYRGFQMTGVVDGNMPWTPMAPASNGAAVYSTPVHYANGWGKVVLYRMTTGRSVGGSFTVEGCVVDALPVELRAPRTPRLPPRVLKPGEDRMLNPQPIPPKTTPRTSP